MPTPYALSSDLVSAWPAKSLEIATYLDTSLAAKTDTAMTQNAQTGTTYSFALADASKLLTTSNASPVSVTVTKQATVTWVTGTQLRVINLGAGVTTLVADTGVTINGNVTLKQYQGGTLIRTASDVWLFVPTASGSGMDLITPTSVAGTGVTLSGGKVSFSAATGVSTNGCFTSAYDNYLVLLDMSAASAANTVSIRLRLSGSDAATAYSTGLVYSNYPADTGGFIGTSFGTTGFAGLYVDTSGGAAVVNMFNPALARKTIFTAQSPNSLNDGTGNARFSGGQHITATAYDGFSVLPNTGNITGSLRVYGMRNS